MMVSTSTNSSMSEDEYTFEVISSDPNWRTAKANELQYGDLFILSPKEIVQVNTVRKYQKNRNHQKEVSISGKNLMENNAEVQYKFSYQRELKLLKDAQITNHRVLAFEPEDDLIYIHGAAEEVYELNIASKRSQFDLLAPSDASKVIAHCLKFDGELQLIGFSLKQN